jgi:large subunit ribosomal protein L15
MRLNDLGPAGGATRRRIRIGRGHGSGKVKTGGKGTKGQNARAGGGVPPYFEGGQLPLIRKLPYRRGFVNPFRVEYREVNVRDLAVFEAGASVGPDELAQAGLLHGKAGKVKVLGDGELAVRLTVRAHRFTGSARQKIEAAGGTVEELEPRAEPEAPKQPRPRRATDEDSE